MWMPLLTWLSLAEHLKRYICSFVIFIFIYMMFAQSHSLKHIYINIHFYLSTMSWKLLDFDKLLPCPSTGQGSTVKPLDCVNLFIKLRLCYVKTLNITNLRGNHQNVWYIEVKSIFFCKGMFTEGTFVMQQCIVRHPEVLLSFEIQGLKDFYCCLPFPCSSSVACWHTFIRLR